MAFVPVNKGEVGIGKPLPWPLYDQNQTLLLANGSVIETDQHLDILAESGLYRDTQWRAKSGQRPDAAPAAAAEKKDEAQAQDQKHYTLDDLKLPVGENLQLQTRAEQCATRYYVRVIGYVKGQSLLVSTPAQEGKILLMREGQDFIVRVFAGKSAFAFSSNIVKVCNVPYPYLHLSYPNEITGVMIRKSPRIDTCAIASVSGQKQKKTPAMLVNLSTTGALLHARTELGQKDEVVTVAFRVMLNGMELVLNLPAKLRSIFRKESEGGNINHGVEFCDLADQDKVALQAYVYWSLIENQAEG